MTAMTTTQNVRTAAGLVHVHTIGRTFKQYGATCRNAAGSSIGRADCGSQTSSAAVVTDEPATCSKCIARSAR